MNTTTTAATGTGKPGDFNFLDGRWIIHNRRLKARWTSNPEWETFDGASTCWTVLGGAGSIEELRIPDAQPRGLGIRLLDVNKGVWSDYWTSNGSGLVLPPPATGSFQDGVGTFTSTDERDGDIVIWSRGVWDRITPLSCRWHQAFSRDGGKTWEANWTMDWTRVA